ncbi:hypothetical protein F4778DRAFT_523803 [Xylariomycetidae sp. FL2044]|nr:hypothetical protein F4778DRAFT_523803 [Xylariomycetidae sp. FL2044]
MSSIRSRIEGQASSELGSCDISVAGRCIEGKDISLSCSNPVLVGSFTYQLCPSIIARILALYGSPMNRNPLAVFFFFFFFRYTGGLPSSLLNLNYEQ